MTADDRLNQLEPIIAEAITILDRHTNQLKQLTVATGQIITAVTQQGESISFLLREQLKMKGDIVEMKGDIVEMKGSIDGIKGQQDGMNGKLDQILQLLQKSGQ
ncbi:hypothetical protein ACVWYF_002232 [Hymenobacter sp. UYAg731]